ncbi:MAG: acyltransferase [Candidatus Nomurabacteria bacterium]|jgi:peptidoglycan/LPS O-acetylase OafA/YrhL|nr:acyltransferase [Candidatus Nomurabacteria bacterium]
MINKFFKNEKFDPKNNGLNLIRLLLALCVIVTHGFALTGASSGVTVGAIDLGAWAVTGFFAISGYLIMASRTNNRLAPYLLKRIARIIPAYLVCLLAVVLLFAPLAHLLMHGSLSGYLTTPPTPVDYFLSNANLAMVVGNYNIGDTLSLVPFSNTWNGVLYTLYYEFLCYLIIGFLMVLSIVRRHPKIICWLFVISAILPFVIQAQYAALSPHDSSNGLSALLNIARFLPIFLGGAAVYVLKDKLINKFDFKLVVLSVVVVVAANFIPHINYSEMGFLSPFILYILFWISIKIRSLRISRFTRQNDISYGIYIYGWVIQQMVMVLVINGLLPSLSIWLDILLVAIITAVFAALSWVFVEKPILNRAKTI